MRFILLFLLLIANLAGAHNRISDDKVTVLKEADLIFEGEVLSEKIVEGACSKTFSYELKIGKILKGKTSLSKMPFVREEFIWRDACPSVHYKGPFLEIELKKGTRALFTLRAFNEQQKKDFPLLVPFYVTGVFAKE